MVVARTLPKHVQAVVSRGREYFYFQLHRLTPEAGPRIKIDDPTNEAEIAQAHLLSLGRGTLPEWDKELRRVLTSSKSRARGSRIEFGLDQPFLLALLNRQGHRCAVSGIYFEVGGYEACHVKPFALSIDRVDSSRGYTKDNVRLVCCIANFAMGQWGLPAVEKLAEGISTMRRRRTSAEHPTVKFSNSLENIGSNTVDLRGISDDPAN